MIENQKAPPVRPKRQRRALRLEHQEYLVEITDWNWSYSLSLDSSRHRREPYHEFRHIVIRGSLLKPAKLQIYQAEVTLLPDRDLNAERRKDHEPVSIGTLELRNNKLMGLIPMPMDALSPVLLMLISNRFKYLAMSGTELYRRSTRLSGFSLEMTADEEEAIELANARWS